MDVSMSNASLMSAVSVSALGKAINAAQDSALRLMESIDALSSGEVQASSGSSALDIYA